MSLEHVYVPDFIPEEDRAYFEKSGFGRRMGWGVSPAVLVVDMTVEFTSDAYALGRGDTGRAAVQSVRKLLEAARGLDLPVVFTRGAGGPNAMAFTGVWLEKLTFQEDAEEGDEIHPEIAPAEGEVVIEKGGVSAFFDTRLASLLRLYGVDTLIVTGMVTSGCVRATVVDACSHNFRTIVPLECVADRAELSHEVALFEMDLKYADVLSLARVIEELESLP